MLFIRFSLAPGENSPKISQNVLLSITLQFLLKDLAAIRLQVHSQHTIYYSGKYRFVVLPICLYTTVFVLIIQLEVILN